MKRLIQHTSILMTLGLMITVTSQRVAAVTQGKSVRIVQSDAQGVVLEYIPVFHQASKLSGGTNLFDVYHFEGESENGETLPGAPDCKVYSATLRFPGVDGNSVEVLNADYEDVPNVVLAPRPFARMGTTDPELSYRVDPASYSAASFQPNQIAFLSHVGMTRGVVLGNLILSPLQYNASLHTVRKYSRIVVRLTFGRTAVRNAGDDLVHGIALNDAARSTGSVPSSPKRISAVTNSVLSSGVWYRFPVTLEGMYKFTGQALLDAGIPPSTDPKTIRVFGNGGIEVPMDVTAPYVDDLLENAVYVNDGGTAGQLDPSDYIIFYGKGTRDWTYNSATKTFSHYIHHTTETNYYWLTYGGAPSKQMSVELSGSSVSVFKPTTVVDKIFREDEKVNLLSSGLEWLGQPFTSGDQFTYVNVLDGLDASQPITYRCRVGALSSGYSTFTIYEGNRVVSTVGIPQTNVGDYYSNQFVNSIVTQQLMPDFTDNRSRLRFNFSTYSSSGTGYLDWYEIYYHKFLQAQNDLFAFNAQDTSALAEYDISGFSGGQILVFDVSRFDSAVVVASPRISVDTCAFQVPLSAGSSSRFFVVGQGGFKTPTSLQLMGNQNLHGDTTQATYIIITHPDFISAAQRLKSFRERSGPNYLKTSVVDVTQIYNEFGGGLPTPVAIRNYLRYVFTNWQAPPKYVLLFGDGDYDYKKVVSTSPNWIPPWETFESFFPLLTYECEDDFVTFSSSRRIEIALGRLAARSSSEANTMVDKIIEYEGSPATDPWKVRTTFVADDGLAGVGPDGTVVNDLFLHTNQAEAIAQMTPDLFEKKKIYLYQYPTVYTPAGRRKPDVNTAIVNQINQGTLVLNFTGHGNPRVWTHEQVFVRETDFPLLANRGKYFFLVGATCNYSHVDMVNDQSGGEILMAMPNAGAIAVLSATRPVVSGDNFALNQSVYQYLFQQDVAGNLLPVRTGDIIYRTKQDHYGPGSVYDNDRKFFLLGDPALQIGFPKKFVTVDSINGVTSAQTGQLRALSPASIAASVHDSIVSGISSFNGTSQLVVFDANQSILLKDSLVIQNPPNPPIILPFSDSFTINGNTLFRGEQHVTNGKLLANFIVPKDISYGNDYGRMTFYVSDGAVDGAGYSTNFRVGGTDSVAAPDTHGPKITLFLDSRSFRSGDVVSSSPTLIADLFDSSGINTSGAGVGHRLEVWIDNKSQSIDVGDYYKSKTDTYREGTVTYPLGALAQGSHRLRMRVWDTYNNSATNETIFDVVTSVGLQLSNVYNFPNPVRSNTIFTFVQNQLSPIDAEVKIYTVAGRLLQSIKKTGMTDAFVQIPWDGRDRDGDVLANGVYLFKIIARTQDNRFTSEALGKLSIIK